MSVNNLKVPPDFSEDSDINGKPQLQEVEQKGKNLRAETHAKDFGPDPVSKEFSNDDSANAAANRLHNNAKDPTERDPTRSTDKPMSGKIKP